MSTNHPKIEDLQQLLEGRSQPGIGPGNARLIRFLLAGPPECREFIRAAGWSEQGINRLLFLPSGASREAPRNSGTIEYGSAFGGADRRLADFLSPEQPGWPPLELLDALKTLSEDERISRLAVDRRYAHPRVVMNLIEHSHSLRYEHPAQMLHWAHLARLAADGCKPETTGSESKLYDLKARAWSQYGNSLRVSGWLTEAGEALAFAQQLARKGTGDPLLKARVLDHSASLQLFRRNTNRAAELAEEASEIYFDLDEMQMWSASQVILAMAYMYAEEPDAAVEVLNRTIPKIDAARDPRLLLVACHNLVNCFIDLGMPEQACSLFADTRELQKELKDTLMVLRLNWQEGQLLRDLGRLETAEEALLKVREGFRDRGLAYEVSLVSLDLAAVYVKVGATLKARQTIGEALPTFRALQIDRETIAALLQLQQVANHEAKALELFRTISGQLEQFRKRPRDTD